jgi:hypothetical protein
MITLDAYERALQIRQTNYGRTAGWVVERNGLPIALLTEPRQEDMFWVSYQLHIITEDEKLSRDLGTKEFWKSQECSDLVWRSRQFGDIADGPFPAGAPFTRDGRLIMRALYLHPTEPDPGSWLDLALRVAVTSRRLWQRFMVGKRRGPP